MTFRLLTILACVALAATFVTCQRHNWMSGQIHNHDYIICRQKVQNLSVQHNKVLWKAVSCGVNTDILSFINVTDQYTNGKGGYVKIEVGGWGYPFVTLNFTSQPGSGINFNLEVWGR